MVYALKVRIIYQFGKRALLTLNRTNDNKIDDFLARKEKFRAESLSQQNIIEVPITPSNDVRRFFAHTLR